MGQVMMNVTPRSVGGSSGGGDSDFVGTVLTHKFSTAEKALWRGYDGTGEFEGIWNKAEQKLYL